MANTGNASYRFGAESSLVLINLVPALAQSRTRSLPPMVCGTLRIRKPRSWAVRGIDDIPASIRRIHISDLAIRIINCVAATVLGVDVRRLPIRVIDGVAATVLGIDIGCSTVGYA